MTAKRKDRASQFEKMLLREAKLTSGHEKEFVHLPKWVVFVGNGLIGMYFLITTIVLAPSIWSQPLEISLPLIFLIAGFGYYSLKFLFDAIMGED